MKKIGIMGGTFNPPHFGHFIMAEQAYTELQLDYVLFIPTGKIVYKTTDSEVSDTDRLCMLKSVVDRNPAFMLSDIEIFDKSTTYTSNTLRRLKDEFYSDSELFFIVGADSLDYMDTWYKPEVLFSLCTVVSAGRFGFSSQCTDKKISELEDRFSAKIIKINMPFVDISSTLIRDRVKIGKSIRYLTDDKIIEYINNNLLYRNQ